MEYFAGLDVSMEETHVCVVTRNGTVVFEAKGQTQPELPDARRLRLPRKATLYPGTDWHFPLRSNYPYWGSWGLC